MKLEAEGLGHHAPLQPAAERPLLVHHVARITGYSRRMVRHLAQIGELPGFKLGKKIWGFDRSYILSRWGRL
jgi:hypothetical protein